MVIGGKNGKKQAFTMSQSDNPKYKKAASKKNDHDADDMKMKKNKFMSTPKGADNHNTPKKAPGMKVGTSASMIKGKGKKKSSPVKKSGTFDGKSNALGHGGRAAQLKSQGVPGGVIGTLARRAQAGPGQANFHGKSK